MTDYPSNFFKHLEAFLRPDQPYVGTFFVNDQTIVDISGTNFPTATSFNENSVETLRYNTLELIVDGKLEDKLLPTTNVGVVVNMESLKQAEYVVKIVVDTFKESGYEVSLQLITNRKKWWNLVDGTKGKFKV